MIVLLIIIIVLGSALLAATAYMEWVGVMNLFTDHPSRRYSSCGHVRLTTTAQSDRCWRCRHTTIDHALHGHHQ